MDLHQIFRGSTFIGLPDDVVETLDDGARARLDAVRVAYEASRAADENIAALKASIEDRVATIRDLQNHMAAKFPKPTFLDLWRETRAS